MSKIRASCFITGFKHRETDESTQPSQCLEPVMKHPPSFLTYYIKTTRKKKDEKEVFLTNQSVIRNTKRMANEVTVSKVQTKSIRYTDSGS